MKLFYINYHRVMSLKTKHGMQSRKTLCPNMSTNRCTLCGHCNVSPLTSQWKQCHACRYHIQKPFDPFFQFVLLKALKTNKMGNKSFVTSSKDRLLYLLHLMLHRDCFLFQNASVLTILSTVLSYTQIRRQATITEKTQVE